MSKTIKLVKKFKRKYFIKHFDLLYYQTIKQLEVKYDKTPILISSPNYICFYIENDKVVDLEIIN